MCQTGQPDHRIFRQLNTFGTILEGRSERNDVHNVRDLERVLHEEWNRISMAVVRRLISSMRRRCGAAVDSNGGHTRY